MQSQPKTYKQVHSYPINTGRIFSICGLLLNLRLKVLKTGDEITEVDNSGFNVQESTVQAFNLGNQQYIVQICPSSIHLLEGANKLSEIELDRGGPTVSSVSSQDPHTVLLMSDGSIRYLELVKDFESPKMKLSEPLKSQVSNKIVYRYRIS